MKLLAFNIMLLFICQFGWSQQISNDNLKRFSIMEDSMKNNAWSIIQDSVLQNRMTSDSTFTKQLVRALKINHSFYYPFDSLYTISKLYAPDSSFRIFTWQINVNHNLVIQHGAIQMQTDDGSLKLIPLFDRSDAIKNINDTIVSNINWVGAIYYKVLVHQIKTTKYYTLIGFDENNAESNKKIIEVMHFEKDRPIFGGNFFKVPKDVSNTPNPARFIMEYKKDAGVKLNYDEDLGMILKEHLVSNTNEPDKKSTLVGDGDYEGFIWKNGKWEYVSKVFNQVTPTGNAPVPTPIRDEKGNIDDTKLKGKGD